MILVKLQNRIVITLHQLGYVFITPKSFISLIYSLFLLLPPAPGNHLSAVLYRFAFSRVSHKWNYTTYSIFCLASFTWHVFEIHSCCWTSGVNSFLFLYTPVSEYITKCLLMNVYNVSGLEKL